jgi:hypothetical protein
MISSAGLENERSFNQDTVNTQKIKMDWSKKD